MHCIVAKSNKLYIFKYKTVPCVLFSELFNVFEKYYVLIYGWHKSLSGVSLTEETEFVFCKVTASTILETSFV